MKNHDLMGGDLFGWTVTSIVLLQLTISRAKMVV